MTMFLLAACAPDPIAIGEQEGPPTSQPEAARDSDPERATRVVGEVRPVAGEGQSTSARTACEVAGGTCTGFGPSPCPSGTYVSDGSEKYGCGFVGAESLVCCLPAS